MGCEDCTGMVVTIIDEVGPTFEPRMRSGLYQVVAGAESVACSACGSGDSSLSSPTCVAGIVFSFRRLREASSCVSPSISRNVFLTTTFAPRAAGKAGAMGDVYATELVVIAPEASEAVGPTLDICVDAAEGHNDEKAADFTGEPIIDGVGAKADGPMDRTVVGEGVTTDVGDVKPTCLVLARGAESVD